MSEILSEQEAFLLEDLPIVVVESESEPQVIYRRSSVVTVLRHHDASLRTDVVIKRVSLPKPQARTPSLDQLENEAHLMPLLSHPNLLQCLDFRPSASHVDLVLEAGTCSLAELLSRGELTHDQILTYFSQICQGLAFLHSRNIAHNDLKAENIIIVNGVAKIGDFGHALLLTGASEDEICRFRGTAGFIAPEVIRQEGCSLASDIWSLGATLYQMVCCHRPYAEWTETQTFFQVAKRENPPVLRTGVPCFDELISRCQQILPKERPTADQLLSSLP